MKPRLLTTILNNKSLRRVTEYVTPTYTAKATRQRRHDGRGRAETILLTIGRPNYRERAFIKWALEANEPFPIRKLQLTFWPKKRVARAKRKK